MIPESQWKWGGFAAHLCVGNSCRFHMATIVGSRLISTVGDCRQSGKENESTEIGYERLYETYVFRVKPRCKATCHCLVCGYDADFDEIDSLPANDAVTAEANHMTLCHKHAEDQENEGCT